MTYRTRRLFGLGSGVESLNSLAVLNTTVEPGRFSPWLDAALRPSQIPSAQADRVKAAVRAILETSGSRVDQVEWGGGEGLEDIRGRVYVRWQPDKPYNAVDYANIAQALFMAAAEGFPAGAQLIMNRYRIEKLIGSDLFVYPSPGREIPPSAPPAAFRRTSDMPVPVAEPVGVEEFFRGPAGQTTLIATGVGVGALVLVAGGIWYYRKRRAARVRPNAKRGSGRGVTEGASDKQIYLVDFDGGGFNYASAVSAKQARVEIRRKLGRYAALVSPAEWATLRIVSVSELMDYLGRFR